MSLCRAAILLVFSILGAAAPGAAQDTSWLVSGDPLRGPDIPFERIKYGPAIEQAVRYNRPRSGERPPLVFLVGDSGWRGGAENYTMHLLRSALYEAGYAFAAADFRSQGPVKAQVMVEDVAAAFAKLVADADELRFDPDRVVLLGNGPGGHIVTLLGTDPSLFPDQALFASIKGVVSVNGNGFDVIKRIKEDNEFRAAALLDAFGSDPAIQARLSPVNHLARPNAPAFLFQAATDHPDIQLQAFEMFSALKGAGAKAAYAPLVPWYRNRSNSYYGGAGNLGFRNLVEFLHATVGPPQ